MPHERAYRRSFSDEVAIDFPSSSAAIELFRRDHGDRQGVDRATDATITISSCQAGTGAMVPLEVRVPRTCPGCGGRGETWSEHCGHCDGQGQQLLTHHLTVAVPPGVRDGDRFSFNLSRVRSPRARVDVRVAVTA